MKKVIGILVLGLLWCNVGFADCLAIEEKLPLIQEPDSLEIFC
ncbi:MAG: hypothetical protein QGG44_07670 [Alphaproteobacteria bacterium]|nr:hypothetical protein [Alphaproteobacteria bacterium]